MVAHTLNPGTQDGDAGRSEFQASQNCAERPCLKKQTKKKKIKMEGENQDEENKKERRDVPGKKEEGEQVLWALEG